MGFWNRHNFLFWWSIFIIENSAVDQNVAGIGGSLNSATYSIIVFFIKKQLRDSKPEL